MLIPKIIWTKAEKLAEKNDTWENIARIRRRLADLNDERIALERELEAFEEQLISGSQAQANKPVFADAPVTNSLQSTEKMELFRQLFAGRPTSSQFANTTKRTVTSAIRRPVRMSGRKESAASRR